MKPLVLIIVFLASCAERSKDPVDLYIRSKQKAARQMIKQADREDRPLSPDEEEEVIQWLESRIDRETVRTQMELRSMLQALTTFS